MTRLLWISLLFLSACSSPRRSSETSGPPSVGGVRPGMRLAKAIELLPPAKVVGGDPGLVKDGKRYELQDTEVVCSVGQIVNMKARRLDHGKYLLRAGDSKADLTQLLGPAHVTYHRGSDEIWQYELKPYRYDVVLNGPKVQWVEISVEPPELPRKPAAYGVGTYGTKLPNPITLAIDGVSLGNSVNDVTSFKGGPDPRTTGSALGFGPNLTTLVEFGPRGARAVLGRTLLRDGVEWVTVGMPAEQAQTKLAEVARLRSQSGTMVSYTFLDRGIVRMLIEENQTVGALELEAP